MAPEPGEVGIGDQETPTKARDLAKRLGEIINKIPGKDNLKVSGLILIPDEGTVHPVVQDLDTSSYYAIGGQDLKDLFPIESTGGTNMLVHWSGSAGDKTYRSISADPEEGKFISSDTELGIDYKKKTPNQSDVDGRSSVIILDTNGTDLVGQADNMINQILSKVPGGRPEFLDRINKGLDKAGGGTAESANKTVDPMAPTIVS